VGAVVPFFATFAITLGRINDKSIIKAGDAVFFLSLA
jgi:hypothetical protein